MKRGSREGTRAKESEKQPRKKDPRIHSREAKQCEGAEEDSRETKNARWTKGKREKIKVSETN